MVLPLLCSKTGLSSVSPDHQEDIEVYDQGAYGLSSIVE